MMIKGRSSSFDLVTIEVVLLVLFGVIIALYAVVPKTSWGADRTLENKWVSVAAGKSHSLGIKSDGTLWIWGLNEYGQLGDGTTTERSTLVQISRFNLSKSFQ